MLVTVNNLAGLLESKRDYAAAEPLYRQLLEARKKALGNEHLNVACALERLGNALGKQPGKGEEAERVLRESLAMHRKLGGPNHPHVSIVLLCLADAVLAGQVRALLADAKFADAEPSARECLAIHERQLPDYWQTFNARSLLGGSLLGQEKYAEAESLLLSGYEGMKQREERIPAAARPLLKEALQRLVQLYETRDRKDQATEWQRKLAEFEQAEAAKQPVPPPR